MYNTSSVSSSGEGSLRSFVREHPLPVFVGLVFVLTWPLQIVDALGSHGILPYRVPVWAQVLFVAYMPTLAAVITTSFIAGRSGIKQLFCRLLIWRVGLHWYLVAVFGFAVVCILGVLLGSLVAGGSGAPLFSRELMERPLAQVFLMVPALFLVVTLVNGEELAWRGFALPRLQARWNALEASLLLGLVWIVFHLPLLLTSKGAPLDALAMTSWSVQLLAASVIFTWLFNHTRGSVLLAYLLHGSINTWTRVFPLETASPAVGWSVTGLVCLAAVTLVAVCGAEHLNRTQRRVQHMD